ncbi:MAG: hypothetical protein IKW48_00565 [Akkermansia sp.]|nr:hypothetical protein [Akkermansia sp.]
MNKRTKISKNDEAWEQLFNKHQILDKINSTGQYIIKAEEINTVREARLMTKIDHEYQLPKIFKDNGLSILPISRGEYIISKALTFTKIQSSQDCKIKEVELPPFLESISPENITSEAIALNSAYAAGIISDFLGEDSTYPTLSGRMGSGEFSFDIHSKEKSIINIHVDRAQMEIDACYEGERWVCIIEAKNSFDDDFIIRQLYYPYRALTARLKKSIRTVFFTYSNDIYHLREYKFDTPQNYNSISFVGEKRYRIKRKDEEITINIESIQNLAKSILNQQEPEGIPFPQADNFERIIYLCEIIHRNNSRYTKSDLSINSDFTLQDNFDPRQVDYYTNAAQYLGLISKNVCNKKISYSLTPQGTDIFNTTDYSKRQLQLIRCILEHSSFRETLNLYLHKAEIPSIEEIVQIMKNRNLYKVSADSTYKRRAQTVKSWVNWIVGTINE